MWYSRDGLKGKDRRIMGKSTPTFPFDQVDISRQKVEVGSGEEVSEF